MISPRAGAVYRLLADDLRDRIESGTYQPGQRLPSEKDLMAEFGRARETVRKALAIVRDEGLVIVRHGYPSRVADRKLLVETVRVMRGSELVVRRATAEERERLGLMVVVLADPSGRERVYAADRARFTFS